MSSIQRLYKHLRKARPAAVQDSEDDSESVASDTIQSSLPSGKLSLGAQYSASEFLARISKKAEIDNSKVFDEMAIYDKKGTPKAVRAAINAFFDEEVTVTELLDTAKQYKSTSKKLIKLIESLTEE